MAAKPDPLPLNDTLRDLALLRASDLDLSALLDQPADAHGSKSAVDATVDRSYELAREARAALKILHRDEVETQGSRVEGIRNLLEDVKGGLDAEH